MQSNPSGKAETLRAAARAASAALAVLALCAPVVLFSHLPWLFGVDFVIPPAGFETLKASLLAAAGIGAGLFALLGGGARRISRNERLALAVMCLSLCVSTALADPAMAGWFPSPSWYSRLSAALGGNLPPAAAVFGVPEKLHGLLFCLGLVGLWLSFRTTFSEKARALAGKTFIWTLAGTGAYAAVQKFGQDPVGWDTRVELSRVFSTMGNANYYAGLLLPAIPLALAAFRRQWLGYAVAAWLALVLVWTKAFWGLGLFAAWACFRLWSALRAAKGLRAANLAAGAALFLACSAGVWAGAQYGIMTLRNGVAFHADAEKWKGFLARPYLWRSAWDSLSETPKTFLLGRGPDSLKPVFERFRRPELSVYEDPRFTADRAHNWLLDLWHNFGLLGFAAISTPLFFAAKKSRPGSRQAAVLWAVFFFTNIPVSANWALLAYALADRKG